MRLLRVAWSGSSETFTVNFFMAVKWHSIRLSHEEYVGVHTGLILFFLKNVASILFLWSGRLSMMT